MKSLIILPEFKCNDLSLVEYESIALDRVNGKILKKESLLFDSCWFDYRFLHPTEKTYLFAHYFEEAYRYMIRLHVDYEQVEGNNPRTYLPKNDPLGKTKTQLAKDRKLGKASSFKITTGVWKARQAADEIGMPYDIFCMSGVKAAVGRIWKRMPSPSQLYSDNIYNAIIDRWASLLGDKIFVAQSPFFEIKNWQTHPSQVAHAHWVIDQIKSRVNPEFALAQYGFIRKLIPPQMMAGNFSDDVIVYAKKISKD